MQFALTAGQKALKHRARSLARDVIAPRAASHDRSETYPFENVQALVEAGFAGMTLPRELGGAGASFLDAVVVIEELAKHCTATARIMVETNMGAVSAICRYGSDKQKRMVANLVLGGDKPAICITEPDAGSAASDMTTTAVKTAGGYVLNGLKHWITGGGVSKLHLVFARAYDEAGTELGIGGFLALRDRTPGLIVGRRIPTMGIRAMPETEIILRDALVPEDMVLHTPGGWRTGFADLMTAYNSQRVGAATVALGVAAGAYELALAQVSRRHQFDRPIVEFQGLQWMLADMNIQLNAARALIHRAAASGNPFPDPLAAAEAKIFAAETAIKVVTDAQQMFGASGYSRELPLERMARDVRMFTVGGGTTQVLRNLVAEKITGRKFPQRPGPRLEAPAPGSDRRLPDQPS